MVLRIKCILPCRVELVDLDLQYRICIRVCQETVHDARERDGRCVRPSNDGNNTIAGELTYRYSSLVRKVFVVLYRAIKSMYTGTGE